MAGVTRKSVSLLVTSLVLVLAYLLVVPLLSSKIAFADYPPSILHWSLVNTPSTDGNVVASSSEINKITFGPDDQVMYAVDIPKGRLYKSMNKGVTWDYVEVVNALIAAGASLPVWDVAVSPDDVNFVVVVTDKPGAIVEGPQAIFVSIDGGQNWQNTNFPGLGANEYISCLAISLQYDIGKRYIAIATRNGSGNGRVITYKAPGPSSWENQSAAPSINWSAGDVVALNFSPSYTIDSTIIIVFASSSGLFLNIGSHDIFANKTIWRSGLGYPVKIMATDNRSPTHNEIITADLELPSDFFGSDPGNLRRYFVSFDARTEVAPLIYFSGIYRIDNAVVYQLMYSTCAAVAPPAASEQRISSIAYYGTYASGKLIAGETTTAVNRGTVDIWLCLDPFTIAPTPGWRLSIAMKSPTGGGTTGRANSLLLWNAQGDKIYCGTSSADFYRGGTALDLTPVPSRRWPGSLLADASLDESAFSISVDGGQIWNQLSLIDTEITRLTDVAVIEAAENSNDYSILYLASVNSGIGTGFDSIWRSVTDPLGVRWERILCTLTANNDIILRVNPRISDDNLRSKVIMFADLNSENICYSADEGQRWEKLYPNVPITDFTLASDTTIYVLEDTYVFKATRDITTWRWGVRQSTGMTTGHTITTPLKNPKGKGGQIEDWVIVGSAITGEVAFADFSQQTVKFEPPLDQRKKLPMQGDVHVIADEQFEANYTIYAASGNVENGKIYRWIIGKSTEWDELKPPSGDFRGLAQRRGVLYGVFDLILSPYAGVDRTLYPRASVPPPPEWDDLTADMPPDVRFTREPSALRISGNVDNNLWAIDNRNFNWNITPKQGCLWNYTDTLAKHGPWTTAPASNDVIAVDPVTGRADEVNFAWRQISYAQGYELQIAKDKDFILRVFVNDNIVPLNPVSPAWVQFPGLLEAGHKYFWRVRASRASTGEIIRSPWSATMYFTVMAGFPVQSKHLGPTLLHPPNYCILNNSSFIFSWSPMFQTTSYRFVLARDPALTQIIDDAVVSNTTYEYKGNLEKGTYFWQVSAIKPMLSEASPIGSFAVTDSVKTASLLGVEVSESVLLCVWVGMVIYGFFIIVVLALIIRARYRS